MELTLLFRDPSRSCRLLRVRLPLIIDFSTVLLNSLSFKLFLTLMSSCFSSNLLGSICTTPTLYLSCFCWFTFLGWVWIRVKPLVYSFAGSWESEEAAAVGSNSCYCLPLTVVDFSEPVSYAGLCAITARYLFFLSALLADLSAAIYDLVEFLRGGDMEHLGCSSGSICLSFWGWGAFSRVKLVYQLVQSEISVFVRRYASLVFRERKNW